MKLTQGIQEALLSIICYEEGADGALAFRGLLESKYFDPFYRQLVEEAYQFIDQYGRPPGEHTLDLIDTLKARGDSKEASYYERILVSLEEIRGQANKEYTLKEARQFLRHQKLKRGIATAIDLVQNEDIQSLDEAELVLRASLEDVGALFDPGTLFSDPARSLRFLDALGTSYETGIELLDRRGLGPARQRLHVFAAAPGLGKSWWLIWLTRMGYMTRKRVLYVTLELAEEEVSQRLHQCIYSITKRPQTVKKTKFKRNEHGYFLGMEEEGIPKPLLSLGHPEIRERLKKKMKRDVRIRPKVFIKQFPTGMLTVPELESYLNLMEATEKFIPDLLIIDYADIMTVSSSSDYRLALGQLYKELRGLAVKRNIAVATASQLSKAGAKAKTATAEYIAEDYSKIATADVVITYSQTKAERAKNLARIFVAKGRTDVDKFGIIIAQAYRMGKFLVDSVGELAEYHSVLKGDDGD